MNQKQLEQVLKERMIKRGDQMEIILKRLEGDKTKFDSSIEQLADLVLDTSYSNILDDARIIYSFYQERVK